MTRWNRRGSSSAPQGVIVAGAHSWELARALCFWRALLEVGARSWDLARALGCWRVLLDVGARSWMSARWLHGPTRRRRSSSTKRLRQVPRGCANPQEAAPTPKRSLQAPRGRANSQEAAPETMRLRQLPRARAGNNHPRREARLPTVAARSGGAPEFSARGAAHVERARRDVPHPPERPQRARFLLRRRSTSAVAPGTPPARAAKSSASASARSSSARPAVPRSPRSMASSPVPTNVRVARPSFRRPSRGTRGDSATGAVADVKIAALDSVLVGHTPSDRHPLSMS